MIKACRIWIKTIPPELQEPISEDAPKKHIIYDRQPNDILSRIGDCISLNTKYQQSYNDVKQSLLISGAEK